MVCDVGKKIVAGILCSNMLIWGVPPAVLASDISNVNPSVIDGKNVYNIDAEKFSGSTQFRQYNNFNLSKESDISEENRNISLKRRENNLGG